MQQVAQIRQWTKSLIATLNIFVKKSIQPSPNLHKKLLFQSKEKSQKDAI